ncbi:TetR/AcrR family transcriptional regulator [Nocardia terpenica]|uniref:TetR/AcrR family transcriptional regulator n=1 Tax=Nocardia terpenica TaxID=455432 RepID=UPI001892E186|nr:TetR/AcrR family transcriptional regulator [Nocardia terpenica]MBF6066109.1 TetR/AcrR family transcriptional regulator [Nocardia terpenica]MBF6109200.1 TetR/AcrR family transcriptional regulator [Nocardia terpenica]MBF6116353.1 TetR/AcrR family transcriptional regulator [Nocardia terpenica]MBF6123510.1 TetR/AcrR family transcriptional regulator [Nocardia terpenica]MBF6156787.1 TetR/AcrR family transcriptional regulator [Nocardia terpenica]
MSEHDLQRRALRADARRNYERILAVADAAVAEHGAGASLEEIARRAGVGSATLHRHFPTRKALLEAVFHERVEALCARANALADRADTATALIVWLRAVGAYIATTRGLASSLLDGGHTPGPLAETTCYTMIRTAGSTLLHAAVAADAVRPEVSIDDLLTLVNAISLATEHIPGNAAEADRLLLLVIDGIRARPRRAP